MKRFLRNRFLLFLFRERCKVWISRKISLISSWKKELNPVKITSLIVINSVLLSFVYGESIGQAVQTTLSTQQFKKILTEFSIPQAYGKITESKYGGSDTVVINIQDLHLSAEVQRNIGSIIDLFDKKYGVKKIYMEGGYGGVETSWLSEIRDKKEKEETIKKLLETGMLTGGEYYAAISSRANIIKGIEKKEAYLENLKRFGNILSEEKEIVTIIESIDKDIDNLKKRYFNNRQLKAEKLEREYSEGKVSAKKYYGLMAKYAQRYGIDISPEYGERRGMAYKNIARYIELLKESEKINYGQASKELQGLILKLKEVLPYQAYKMITEETANFQNVDKLYTFLIKFSKELKIELAINYPNLNKLFKQIELSRQINPIEMIKEEERFEGELSIAFASDQGSREVAFLAGFIGKIKDYFSTKITADNYERYKENIKEWKRLYIKYIDNKKMEMLKEYEKRLDRFYDINVDRNQYFIENLDFIKEAKKVEGKKEEQESEVEKVIGSLKEAKSVNVVVTGGFHTEALSEMLAKEGISYIVITPNVSKGVEEAERAYHELAKEQSKILFQSLATMPLSQVATIEGKLVGLAQVLIQKDYGTQEINETLEYIGSRLEAGTAFRMEGDVKKEEAVKITINGKAFIRNVEGIFVEQRVQEEVEDRLKSRQRVRE
jgi:hypothetical protein